MFSIKQQAKHETIVKQVASRAFNPEDWGDMFL
jgi:hypothetical protein